MWWTMTAYAGGIKNDDEKLRAIIKKVFDEDVSFDFVKKS